MPRIIRKKVGDIYQVQTVKTFSDYLVAAAKFVGGVLVILFILGLIVG